MNHTPRPGPGQAADPDHIQEALALLAGPGRVFELRAPKSKVRGPSFRRFVAEDLTAAVRWAVSRSGKCTAVYVSLNPIRPGLDDSKAATDADILRRRWILIDCDPQRPADTSSTEEEKAAARALAEKIRDHLRSLGWPEPILSDSGNGYHLLYLIDLPTEDEGLVKAVLVGLAARFDSDTCKVDTSVYNPSRICKLYGTLAAKGGATGARPHRLARLLDVPPELSTVPTELLRSLAADLAPAPVPTAPAPERAPEQSDRAAPANGERRHAGERWTPETRAVAYLERCEPAVSGQKGHAQIFKAACKVGPGFDLSPEVALGLLREHYNPRCQPRWSESELQHKIQSAYETEKRRGWLLEARDRGADRRHRSNGAVATGSGVEGKPSANGRLPDTSGREPDVVEAADDPHRLARLYRDQRCSHPDGPTLLYWQGEFVRWDGAYRSVLDQEITAELTAVVKAEFDRLNALDVKAWEKAGGVDEKGKPCPPPTARKVTKPLIGNVAQALRGYTKLDARIGQPAWLMESPPFPALEVLPARNVLIYLPALISGRAAVRKRTPLFFSPYALDYDFDAEAPEPVEWLTFLGVLPVRRAGRVRLQVWPDDLESVATLQEWFGYFLTPDTRQQKIGALIGPRRSGKGTIARILRALIGAENVAGPTLSGLASNFGLAPLIGKPCAIISDARISGRTDQATVVERLLSISGEDPITVDRKHLPGWTGKLPTRITLISNELPRLSDSSGALAGRLIIHRLTRSFYGQEDGHLTDVLLEELPGILLWAIEGWRRLRERGHFVQPTSGREMVEEMEDLASPVGAFVGDCCEIAPGREIRAADLFAAWKTWCTEKGRDHAGTEQEFGRNLRAVLPTLKTPSRRESDGTRKRHYEGLGLCAGGSSPASF